MVDDLSPDEIEIVVKNTRLVLVDAWAPTCGPCKELSPILEEIEEIYSDNPDVRIVKINTGEHIGFASKNDIFALPCVLIFFDGEPAKYTIVTGTGDTKVVDRLIGLRPIEHYEDIIYSMLGIK
ncbi:MAG: thioredoxin family protein [Candidatus Thorarchaeota archaeon]